ncbi:MAG: type II secretion system F family protein [Rubrivivax sp.]|nr:type II secretion system F family protein [Rubrivivax sp.]
MSLPGKAQGPLKRATVVARPTGFALDDEAFARDLGLMLASGLPLIEALGTLRERSQRGLAAVLDEVVRHLRQGESLSAALEASAAVRPALLAAVRSSETSGDLPDALARYARHAARVRELRSRLQSALLYPALLMTVSLGVVVFLLGFVVPRFAGVLESGGGDLPLMTRWMIAVGRGVRGLPAEVWLGLLLLLVWGVFELIGAWRAGQLTRRLVELGARVPLLRELLAAFGHAQFVRSTGMLVRSGTPVLRAMGLCAELLVHVDRRKLERALTLAAAGAPLASTLHEQGLLDGLGFRVLRVAERTGELANALERLAEVQDQALERTLERVGRLVEPLLMLLIGLVIGGIVVLMYLPIFQLAASL